jgi:DNA helicase-2/ATP-dependent DNA helicase PcrA
MSDSDSSSEITPNEQQKAAITSSVDRLRIIAGPGTGKTETLTRRIAHLIEERDVPPQEIIAFTFTEKAADELLTRVEGHVGGLENRPWVGTIHSFCLDLLEDYREEVFNGDHTVLGEEGQLVFLYSNYNELELDNVRFPLDVVAAHFSKAMDLGIQPSDYVQFAQQSIQKVRAIPEHRPDRRSKVEAAEDRLAIANSYQRYHQLMSDRDAVDYATMIEEALDLIEENSQVRDGISSTYSHLLVDEYQDTNRTQEALVDEIVSLGSSLCVVGDDDQSIYRFRGATVDNLLEFDERFESVQTIPIETNYRSDTSIIDVSQEVIRNNSRRLKKTITANSEQLGTVGQIQKNSPESEAAAISDFVQNQLNNGSINSPSEVALLFRSVTRDGGQYIQALRDRGIPVEVTGVADIFQDQIVEAIIATVDYILEESAGEELSNSELLDICSEAASELSSESELSCGHTSCENVASTLEHLNNEYDKDTFVEPKDFFYELLSSFPTIEDLLRNYEDLDTAEELRYLAGLSDVFDQISEIAEHTTLGYLRDLLGIVQDQGVQPDLPSREGGVNVMTIHQAKGLEFDTVIIPALIEGKFPTGDRPNPLQIPSQLRMEPEYKSGDDHLSDERRLFYVAMTRAESTLIVSTHDEGQTSQFLGELPDGVITQIDPKPSVAKSDDRFTLRRGSDLEATSFTQISYFTQCPLKYGLLFDYGFERTDQPQFFYGISVHRALERFFTQIKGDEKPTLDQLLSSLDTEWISSGYAGEEQESQFKNKAEEILTTYFNSHLDGFSRIEYVEHPFSIFENNVRVEGKMDRVDKLPSGKLRVIDFKVGETKEPGPWEVFQLQLYALACERTLDTDVADCRFQFLSSNETVPVEFNDKIRDESLTRLRNVIEQMKGQEYEPNPGEYCDRCDFRGFCPAVETD